MFKPKCKYDAQHRDDYLQNQISETDKQIRHICFNLAVFYLKDKKEREEAKDNISKWYLGKFNPLTYRWHTESYEPINPPYQDDLIKLQKIAFELDNNE